MLLLQQKLISPPGHFHFGMKIDLSSYFFFFSLSCTRTLKSLRNAFFPLQKQSLASLFFQLPAIAQRKFQGCLEKLRFFCLCGDFTVAHEEAQGSSLMSEPPLACRYPTECLHLLFHGQKCQQVTSTHPTPLSLAFSTSSEQCWHISVSVSSH